jgi:transcription termination factor Rho
MPEPKTPTAGTRKKAATKRATKTAKKAVLDEELAAPVVEPAAEKPAAKKKAPARKKADKSGAKEESSTEATPPPAVEAAPSATESAPVPPPIPEPPPIPDFWPTAEELESSVGQVSTPATPEASAPAGDADDADGANPKGRLSRRQRWKEKLRQRYLARQAARAEAAGGGGGGGADTSSGDSAEGGRAPAEPLGPTEAVEGILELTPKGYGFLRLREKLYAPLTTDCWVSADMIRKYGLREGMCLTGTQQGGQRGPQLTELTHINGRTPDELKDLPLFEELKATNPSKRYQLETTQERMTTRVIDMMTPVGRGQRGLIVAPPRAGKTTLLQHIAEAITQNYPQVHLMLLLVDERPEEVTEFRRVLGNAEIFASSNDQDVKSHMRIAQLAIERAKRLVEMGDHVFILMDSITRMARAFNNAQKGGATMSGGMGVGALEIPRRLFAAARNTKTAGSLTVLATALIETGSKMDDLIFQEFKGTGNMELVLDRKIAEQFIYPAVNIFKSGTRREELLLQSFQIEKIHFLRRGLAGHKPIEAVQRVISLLEKYPTNSQMLVELVGKNGII